MSFALAIAILLSPDQQKALKVLGEPLCNRVKAVGVFAVSFIYCHYSALHFSPGFCLFPRGKLFAKSVISEPL